MDTELPALRTIRDFVGVGRAGLVRPHSPAGDADAQAKLVQGIEVLDDSGVRVDVSGPLVDLLAPRARFFDAAVLGAIEDGIEQIVVVGAGHDDRALRFPADGVSYFEIDLPHVVADKGRRLSSVFAGRRLPTLISADLNGDDVGELLAAAGLKRDRRTLFLCEHVLLFIVRDRVEAVLGSLSRSAASGSVLAVTAETHPEGLTPEDVIRAVDTQMFAGTGLIRSIRSSAAWLRCLGEAGWVVRDDATTEGYDHFDVSIDGQAVPIRTRLLAADR